MYIIGIDGGGTKTMATLMNEKGEVLGIGLAAASGLNTVMLHVTKNHIFNAVENAFDDAQLAICPVNVIYAGIGGLVTKEDEVVVNHILSTLPCYEPTTIIHSTNDVNNALSGGLGGDYGICAIASTQAASYGKNERHQKHRCGGYGFKEGDAGSAYALGKDAINHAVRAFDGRVKKTKFSDFLIKELNLNAMVDVMNCMNDYYNDRLKTANLAPIVTRFANENDPHALMIVRKNVEELAACVQGVHNEIKTKTNRCAIVGSLANADGVFKHYLIEKIKEIDPEIIITPWEFIPVIGAGLEGMKLINTKITKAVRKTIAQSYKVKIESQKGTQ